LAEPGKLKLKRNVDSLRVEEFRIHSYGKEEARRDPNRGRPGHYLVPGVNLIESCDGYAPIGILLWLPLEQEFGAWDCDHGDLWSFPGETWSEIAADPVPFVNALWHPDQVEREWLIPWPKYPFVDDAAGAPVRR